MSRGTEDPSDIKRRLSAAKAEINRWLGAACCASSCRAACCS